MKNKLLLGALSLMVVAGGLVGCSAVDEAKDMMSPSPSAPATNASEKPSPAASAAAGIMDDAATTSPEASASPAATAKAE